MEPPESLGSILSASSHWVKPTNIYHAVAPPSPKILLKLAAFAMCLVTENIKQQSRYTPRWRFEGEEV
jgi:hypothetical protein